VLQDWLPSKQQRTCKFVPLLYESSTFLLSLTSLCCFRGAIVRAFDVRAVTKEQVESMGATFLEVPIQEDGAGAGGELGSLRQ